jgi:hypothetical protein
VGDANARALAEDECAAVVGSRGARSGSGTEPERARGAEVGAVEGAVDAQRGGQASGTAGQVEQARGFAMLLHVRDALEGFERADQDAAADSGDFRADVEHEVIAVAEINVGVAAAKEHGAIAWGRSAKVVRGGIASRIGFGFHDATAEAGAGEFADDNFANKKAGQGDRVRRKFGVPEAPDGYVSVAGCHGWQARQSSRAVKKSNLTPYQVVPNPPCVTTTRHGKQMEVEKRRFVRKRTDRLLYAELGPDNGSILLNLCEEGCSFQSVAPVCDERLRLSFSVGDGRKLEGDGQMVWSDTTKKTGGLRFLNPSEQLREQVRQWLDAKQVTADGKLNRITVDSDAKLRRKKLREEARAEAEYGWKGALKANDDAWSAQTAGQAPEIQTAETAEVHPISMSAADDISTPDYGNSTGAWRGAAAIVLMSVVLVALVTHRRELGHLLMWFGSSIAGEEQKSGVTAPIDVRHEPRPVLDAKPTASPQQEDARESGSEAVRVRSERIRPSTRVQATTARRGSGQQASPIEDVTSLWTSVENGDTHAEVILANRYTRGDGVPQSCEQARVLLEAAVKGGNSEAKQKLDELPRAGCP